MLSALRTALPLCALIGSPVVAQDPPPARSPAGRTVAGPQESFSITVPSTWRWRALEDGDWAELGLFADRPHDISILVASRPLRPAEHELETDELLDHLIERTLAHLGELGHEVVQVGRVEPLVQGWPAFAAVASNADRSKMMTLLRSPVGERLYVVATLTDNLQGSPELAAQVSEVVASLEIPTP